MKVKSFIRKFSNKIFFFRKEIYQFFLGHFEKKQVLFIFGCQRSGTTLLNRILKKDFHSGVYNEVSKLSTYKDPDKLRLRPLSEVEDEISKSKPQFIVLKPLVESQNALKLLDYFEDSKCIWLYRDFKDVALSNIIKFGTKNTIKNLKWIVEINEENWRNEGISEETRKIIVKNYSSKMNVNDAAVLFWYVRNILFFELKLNLKANVLLIKYDELIKSPKQILENIYRFSNRDFPGDRIFDEISVSSIGKGNDIVLSPEIEALANNLISKLDKENMLARK